MKAITTRYRGPGNVRGARIWADDGDGNRISISYPYELSGEACHKAAADALCDKMGWTGQMIGGETRTGYVFVFMPPPMDWTGCGRASSRIMDMVCAMYHPGDERARQFAPTSTWAEIIAGELGIEREEER